MSQWPACDASLAAQQAAGDPWGYCTEVHCNENDNYNHTYCNCLGQFQRMKVNGVCPFTNDSLIPIGNPGCYCCCSCFAYDTPIATTENTVKAIQDFVLNDPVLVAEGADLKSWVQKPVLFSAGTGADGKNRLIKIHFGDQTQGVSLGPDSFVSQYVDKQQSADYYSILSTEPNNFIDAYGTVNLQMVKNASVFAVSKLLAVPVAVAQNIYNILSIDMNYLLVNALQPFLMTDGTLKQARKLVPGKDMLVRADGSPTPINSLEVGLFNKGVHHIATSNAPAKSLDGHLLLANGIVAGDYAVQISLASDAGAIDDEHEDAPEFGTKEYNKEHSHLTATLFSVYADNAVTHKADSFETFHADQSMPIPDNNFSFVTKAQADELLERAPMFPPSGNVSRRSVEYLFSLFRGFYPEITFYYDQNDVTPNAYAFKQFDNNFIVVSLGWTLLEGVYFPGLAMTIAHLVNAINQNDNLPVNISPTGKADYEVYPVFLSIFYLPADAVKNYNLGLEQLKQVFRYIKVNSHPPDDISLACRIQTFEASIAGLALPYCAGGPPDPALEVVEVSVSIPENSRVPVVSVQYNLPVDPESATLVGGYLFDPNAVALSAAMADDDPRKVNLVVEIEPDIEYFLAAVDVLSVDRQPLIPDKNGGKFTLKS